jgi:hypothetical protein
MTVTDTDTFEDPEPTRRQIEFDGWGRYKLPDPETGEMVSWTRVTTLAGAMEDQYHLGRWYKRKVLEGITMDRGLVSLAAQEFETHGPDPQSQEAKKALDKIADHAVSLAGASKGADSGTLLHSITEYRNQGKEAEAQMAAVAAGVQENLDIYTRTLARYQVTVVPDFMERVICVPALKVVGRLDNLVREMGNDLLRVFDLKTQKTLDFGAMKIAIQLAIYANGYAMFNEETWGWEEMPAVDKSVATVCWLPVLEGEDDKVCQLYDVDLEWGWRWAKAAFQTRKARNFKPLTLRPVPARRIILPPAEAPKLKPIELPDQVHLPVTEETVASIAAALPGPRVVESGPVTLVPAQALKEDPRALYQDIAAARVTGVDWSARFRHAVTTEELAEIGRECKAAGSLTPTLVALGKERRAELIKAQAQK